MNQPLSFDQHHPFQLTTSGSCCLVDLGEPVAFFFLASNSCWCILRARSCILRSEFKSHPLSPSAHHVFIMSCLLPCLLLLVQSLGHFLNTVQESVYHLTTRKMQSIVGGPGWSLRTYKVYVHTYIHIGNKTQALPPIISI